MFSRDVRKNHRSQIAAPAPPPSVASAVEGIAEKNRGGQGGEGSHTVLMPSWVRNHYPPSPRPP